ncbi:hypothetical protein [Delftia tsuruhatensis]|uniref:hypothetical protein n=1 Tax=Delftia tsuruhatensis TaxID=180282 RepID=UPI00370C1F4A
MLDIFEDKNIPEEKLHNKYLVLRDQLFLTGEQSIIGEWVRGFEDRDNKIVKEFQTSYHSSFWEFYLFALFKEAGLEIDFSEQRPDFIIKQPHSMYIEAVVANIKQNGKGEESRTIEDVFSMIRPLYQQKNFELEMRESITRYANAISSKVKKYDDYKKDNHFDVNTPYLIALSGYEQINYGNKFHYAMIAWAYGLVIDNKTGKYLKQGSIKKPGSDAPIQIGNFLDGKLSHISAVIFSCTATLGKLTSLAISKDEGYLKINSVINIRHDTDIPYYKAHIVSSANPEYLSDGVFIFHNPFAKNPVSREVFKNTNVINVDYDIDHGCLCFDGNNLPIVSRINLAFGDFLLPEIVSEITEIFNPGLVFIRARVQKIKKIKQYQKYDIEFLDVNEGIKFEIIFDGENFEKFSPKKDCVFEFIYMLKNELTDKNPSENADIRTLKRLMKIACLKLDMGIMVSVNKISST